MVSENQSNGKGSKGNEKKKKRTKQVTIAGVDTVGYLDDDATDDSERTTTGEEQCLAAHDNYHRCNEREMLIYSGATAHIFGSDELVLNKRADRNMTIETADETTAPSSTVGTVHVNFPDSALILKEALYSPQLKNNFVSV